MARGWAGGVGAVLVAVVVTVGCASSGGSATPHTSPPPARLPSFYSVPAPLPGGQPGEVIKTEQVAAVDVHGTLLRVMYHSRSVQGADIPVTGLIAVPRTKPPADGYPVISWAHGTTGIADTCAPSSSPASAIPALNQLLDAGYLVVASDYEGLGTPGRHPYIVGVSEARGTLDIVRAARLLPTTHASDRYLVWGHSQGGHAAMFSLHVADRWAPELHLVGVVAGAPPSQLDLVYSFLKDSPFKYYILMAAAGFNAAYGNQAAPLGDVLNAQGEKLIGLVDHGCTDRLAAEAAKVNVSQVTKADPATVPAWKKLLDANDPGKFSAPAREPLLIIQGGKDEQIPVESTQLLFGQLCQIHQDEERWIYPGQSHAGVIGVSLADMLTWIRHRFAGAADPDPMTPTGLPGVQVQRCAG